MSIKKIRRAENIFGDNIAFVEQWDFSSANTSEENRILAITQVASICYQSPKALGSETLYNRLMSESMGLPSSSFEFVPVLLDMDNPQHQQVLKSEFSNVRTYSELIENGRYVLTNYRAIVYDYESNKDFDFDIRRIFNTDEEAEIIRRNYSVFLYKVDLPTRSQMVRHRVNWQELSRRYVSGKRVKFEFYISEKMKDIYTVDKKVSAEIDDQIEFYMNDYEENRSPDKASMMIQMLQSMSNHKSTRDIINLCVDHYMSAIDAGVKPQEARRIIPQAAYSQIWGGFLPRQLENFFKLRLDSHAQWEIQKVAEAMKDLSQ